MSINKVAKLAGVSNSTVSRVINKHPRVAVETASNVRKAMQELNYTPSDRRPGPKPSFRSRTGLATIAFLVLGTSRSRATPAFEFLLRGVSTGASSHGLNLVFNHLPDSDRATSRVLDQRIDGLLLHGAMPGGELRQRLEKLPTVWLMGNRRRPDWGDQVLPDGYEIGEMAARYLTDRGHRQLAFFNLDAGHWMLRFYGHAFQAAAQDAQAHVQKLELQQQIDPEGYWREPNVDAVESLIRQYLALSPRPTGIFVADDMQVAMIQPTLQKYGVQIGPGQVEVISCNNEEPYLVGLNPKPSVVDIRVESIGARGVDQLLWRLENPSIHERIITAIEPRIISPVSVPPEATRRPAENIAMHRSG